MRNEHAFMSSADRAPDESDEAAADCVAKEDRHVEGNTGEGNRIAVAVLRNGEHGQRVPGPLERRRHTASCKREHEDRGNGHMDREGCER